MNTPPTHQSAPAMPRRHPFDIVRNRATAQALRAYVTAKETK